jgi:hypothetical protein
MLGALGVSQAYRPTHIVTRVAFIDHINRGTGRERLKGQKYTF